MTSRASTTVAHYGGLPSSGCPTSYPAPQLTGGLVGLLSTRARALLLSLLYGTFGALVALVAAALAAALAAAALAGWSPVVVD
jgi:hypothetical protein